MFLNSRTMCRGCLVFDSTAFIQLTHTVGIYSDGDTFTYEIYQSGFSCVRIIPNAWN